MYSFRTDKDGINYASQKYQVNLFECTRCYERVVGVYSDIFEDFVAHCPICDEWSMEAIESYDDDEESWGELKQSLESYGWSQFLTPEEAESCENC